MSEGAVEASMGAVQAESFSSDSKAYAMLAVRLFKVTCRVESFVTVSSEDFGRPAGRLLSTVEAETLADLTVL